MGIIQRWALFTGRNYSKVGIIRRWGLFEGDYSKVGIIRGFTVRRRKNIPVITSGIMLQALVFMLCAFILSFIFR